MRDHQPVLKIDPNSNEHLDESREEIGVRQVFQLADQNSFLQWRLRVA